MKTEQLRAFTIAIGQSGLLRDEDLAILVERASAPDADPQTIARELVQRGWLTVLQVKTFWKGRGADLFLNQYVLQDKLGEGGMGEVYKARHRTMDRVVALKLIRHERLSNPDSIRRFQREIQAAAQLSHENVVMAYDADCADGRHFFVMEYVEGTNLGDLVMEHGPLTVRTACTYIRQIALGLQHAHERNMVHRDIKPSNLLVSRTGVVKILDMGLARIQHDEASSTQSAITQEGIVIGTPDFLAPEQARNPSKADIRADIYALGATFYYILSGEGVYPGGTITEKMLRHSIDPIPILSSIRREVPLPLSAIIQKMLAKTPPERYQTPSEVAEALAPYCIDPAAAASGILRRVSSNTGHPSGTNNPVSSTVVPAGTGTAPHAKLVVPPPPPPPPPAVLASASGESRPSFSTLMTPEPFPQTDVLRSPPRDWIPDYSGGIWRTVLALGSIGLVVVGVTLFFVLRPPKVNVASMKPEIRTRHGLVMLLIQPGKFLMGAPEDELGRNLHEGPAHEVEITTPFYISAFEITQGQYVGITGEKNPSEFRAYKQSTDMPIDNVSYYDALRFCERLNADSQSIRPKGMVWRLPTEAEWEYCCRSGTTERFNVGNVLNPEQITYEDSQLKSTVKVGSGLKNAWGLYDMHGNVWEWCNDLYDRDYYANSPGQNPPGSKVGSKRILRGGGWNSPELDCRSSRRRFEYPDSRDNATGFRVVLAPDIPKD